MEFNCGTNGKVDLSLYANLELGYVHEVEMSDGDTCCEWVGAEYSEPDDQTKDHFWTLYGRFAEGGCEALHDLHDPAEMIEFVKKVFELDPRLKPENGIEGLYGGEGLLKHAEEVTA